MTNHQKIIELNKIWYDLIGSDHHKDKDCHFRICTHYYYGDKVEYEVEHHGYIMDDIYKDFDTQKEAEEYLINNVLKKGILKEIEWHLNPPDDISSSYSKDQIEEYKRRTLEIAPD
jgi:hypothetical protein